MVRNYVRAFSDTWAYLIWVSSASVIKKKRKAELTATAATIKGKAYAAATAATSSSSLANDIKQWNNSIPLCNPLFSLKDDVVREAGKVRVMFTVETDDRSGVSQTAVLMLALDSFVSLLASSDRASVDSCKKESVFSIRVPFNTRAETVLNNAGFPAGLCGPFKRWSINFKASGLSGKSGIAGLAGSVLSDINTDIIGKKGTTILDMVNTVSKSAQQLDDSEMSRTLSYAKRLGADNSFSVCNSRQVNQHNLLRHQNTFMRNLADNTQKMSAVKAEVPPVIPEGMQIKEKEPDTDENASGDEEEEENDDEELGGSAAAAAEVREKGKKNRRDNKKTQAKKRSRSRRKGECSVNALSFVEKYAGNCKSLSVKSTGCPPPSKEFTSLFMSGSEADSYYQTSRSMRGASRIRSLLNKYGNNGGKELMKKKVDGSGWRWVSPDNRRVILTDEESGEEIDLVFEVHCNKSDCFNDVTAIALNVKQWVRYTSKLIDNLKSIEEFLPSMGSATPFVVLNLMKTLAGVCSLRDTIGFRIPEHGKNLLPKSWIAPMSSMGITSQRYDRIIEVMDLLITGGAFVTSCLNNVYFYERGVIPNNTWPHVDAMKLSATVFKYVNSRADKHGTAGSYASSAPIVISKNGISIKSGGTSQTHQHGSSGGGGSATAAPQCRPTRQSIAMTISTIINNYTEVSSKHRECAIQKCLTEHGKTCLDSMIRNEGALRALTRCTVKITGGSLADKHISGRTPGSGSSTNNAVAAAANTPSASFSSSFSGNSKKRPVVKIESKEDADADDEKEESPYGLKYLRKKNINKLKKFKRQKKEEGSENGSDVDDVDDYDGEIDVRRIRVERTRKFMAIAALAFTHQSLGNAITQKTKGVKNSNIFNL